MKISIITPSYNQGPFIEETIQSILSQEGDFELEYIVMDGGSTDETVDILKKYEDKITWISEPDRGQSHAINKGMKKTTGDIVAYLNSDDILMPGALQKVSEFFKSHPSTHWVYGKCHIIDESGKEIRKWITSYKNLMCRRYTYNKILAENFISQPATFWKRKVYEEIGPFNEELKLVMDYEYWLRIGEKYDAGYIPEYLAGFRWYTQTKSGSLFHQQFKDELNVAKKYAGKRRWPILLHRFNYYKIVGVYSVLRVWNNWRVGK